MTPTCQQVISLDDKNLRLDDILIGLDPCSQLLNNNGMLCKAHKSTPSAQVKAWYVQYNRYLKVPGLIASNFFQTFREFGIRRKIIFFSLPLVNFTTEKSTFWKILMKM